MTKRKNEDYEEDEEESIPLPIQTFFWRQTSPFIRPKFGKQQDALAMEQREACKSFEKVLVQNIHFGLSPSLTDAIKSITRWKLIQASFPHVMHCCAALLYNRKNSNLDKLGAAETKLLYTLHWIVLDATEECADSELEQGIQRPVDYYILPITTIELFIYLFSPLITYLKHSDFLTSFRLENGYKLWQPLFNHNHPDIPSFVAEVKPKRNVLKVVRFERKPQTMFGDVFIGVNDDKDDPQSESIISEEKPSTSNVPKPVPQSKKEPNTEEKLQAEDKSSEMKKGDKNLTNPFMATYLDVATLRCLFTSQWLEEGIDWGLKYFSKRLKAIQNKINEMNVHPQRSSSLPLQNLDMFSVSESQKIKLEKVEPNFEHCLFPSSSGFNTSNRYSSVQELRRESFGGTSSNWFENNDKTASSKRLKSFKEEKLNNNRDTLIFNSPNHDNLFLPCLNSSYDINFPQDAHRFPRPKSALGVRDEVANHKESRWSKIKSELVRGKSMPSLNLIIDRRSDSHEKSSSNSKLASKRPPPLLSHSVKNPIITITKHSPVSSVQFFLTQDSNDIQKDESIMNKPLIYPPCSQYSITHSQTDSNINYHMDSNPEAPGSTFYISKSGQISLVVMLKAVHSISLRVDVCSPRVCEGIISIVKILLEMGLLERFSMQESLDMFASTIHGSSNKGQKIHLHTVDDLNIHQLSVDTIMKVTHHLGCPYSCNEGHNISDLGVSRKEIVNILTILHRSSETQFINYFKEMILKGQLQDNVDTFHSLLGFCGENNKCLSPISNRRPHGYLAHCKEGRTGYANNFGAGFNLLGQGVEGVIINAIFNPFVTRLMNMQKELNSQENMSLYHDIRQLIAYIRNNYGGVFRRVALSGLLESVEKVPKKQQRSNKPLENENEYRFAYSPSSYPYPEDIDKGQRKSFYRKRSNNSGVKTAPSSSSIYDDYPNMDWSASGLSYGHSSTPVLLRINMSNSPRLSIGDEDNSVILQQKSIKIHDKNKFHLVNWLKGDKSNKQLEALHPGSSALFSAENGFNIAGDNCSITERLNRRSSFHNSTPKMSHKSTSHVSLTFLKARKRMEDQFNKLMFGKAKSKQGSFEDTLDLSRRNSLETDQNYRNGDAYQKESKMVSLSAIRNGMLKFTFLLDSCAPGSLPDPLLIAAVLDIKAPVIARAAFYLECAHFVHSCNKGAWPSWMKHNFPIFRPSNPTKKDTSTCIRGRTSHALHRNAGRMFYLWAEALGAHIEEMIFNEKKNFQENNRNLDDTQKRQLKVDDDNEDFLNEAQVNPSGSDCPFALKLAACQLLLEITTFLRETHQYLPTRAYKSLIRGDKSPFEHRTIVANRRWSMALSSLGFSQNSAHSLISLADPPFPQLGHAGERRISFLLQEADDENSDQSSTTTATHGDDHAQAEENRRVSKRSSQSNAPLVRSHLLRRATGTSTSGAHNGSFKRRSIKLKKAEQRRSRHRASTFAEDDEDSGGNLSYFMKRADSLKTRRKVSGISEKSDTSEKADASGEESPGALSDDGQMAQELSSDNVEKSDADLARNMPWLKVLINLMNTLDYDCTHKHYCVNNCYRRQIRACSRLIKAVKKIYIEPVSPYHCDNMSKVIDDKEDALKKEKKLKKIITGPTSPLRRKISMTHTTEKVDREYFKSHSIHSSTGHIHSQDIEAGLGFSETEARSIYLDSILGKSTKVNQSSSLKYIINQVRDLFHTPMSTLIKGFLNIKQNCLKSIMTLSWRMILETNQNISSTCSVAFILCTFKCPEFASEMINKELQSTDPIHRIKAINKFYSLWRSRYQCWQRMEDGAHLSFKCPPPAIEFTLPSPKIALPTVPVVDSPWMPKIKSKVEEVTLGQEQALQRSFVTATKTRRKQQIELVNKALQDEEEKLREERESYRISAVPIINEAAYEPALYRSDEPEEMDEDQLIEKPPTHHIQVAQALFPSSLCSAAVTIINLLDDSQVSQNGSAIYEVAYKIVWHCLVEDASLFLRHLFEKLTRENQKVIFQILRRLIRFMPRLPAQAAFTLYNYLIGFIMFYVRSPVESSQELIGATLSVLWLVIPSVHGLFLKDLKQVLRKEQCDATLLITANVPSAKKIIVHGPDVGAIPSQFPIQEDTQFYQILIDSLDFFSIDESLINEYFLVDTRTNQMHNLNTFVRDFYFFKRSQYPQLSLVRMNPTEAFEKLQKQAFTLQFVELGKVLMSLSIVKSQYLAIQRVLFLHEELMKLPSFPRKALEANFGLYKGTMGKEILGMDTLHKIVWVKLAGRMLEVASGYFAQSSDIHLFLNVVNGALILHCEDAAMLRLCMATFLNAAIQFRNIFSTNGYFLIMPTILRIYSNHQTNGLLCRNVEFVCKQFYIMHRKPFILQMFGSAASILDLDVSNNIGDASRVQPKAFFQLLQSLGQYIVDPLDILELVDAEKPLKALDFCYQMDPEAISLLDAISLCVTVVAYAADSQRSLQMLLILESILPLFMKHMQTLTMKKETPGGPRTELQMIYNISVCIKTLISNCEALARNFTGPQRAIDLKESSIKNTSKGAYSPPPIEIDDDSHSKFIGESYYSSLRSRQHHGDESAEMIRFEFRRPRDILLLIVSEFLTRSASRLSDLSKKVPDLHQKSSSYELIDVKSHLRLAEIAHSLLKVAPYDPQTMGCEGLVRYMNEILPNSEWQQEAMRPALIMILRRLDKMFSKIAKKGAIRRLTDWEAAKRLLKGVYLTFAKHPYIVHLPHLKSLISICQNIILGDPTCTLATDNSSLSWLSAFSQSPPPGFCSVTVRLIAMQIFQMVETQSLETICGNAFSSPDKTEIYLLNMIYPMCIRISGGLNNVPKLRSCDITFILSVILNTLSPTGSKGNWKSDNSSLLSNPFFQSSLHQIGLLGLKIMMVCFERQLSSDWYRIAKCIREIANKNFGGINLWSFIDFVVTYKTPLFILLLPLIRHKLLHKICENEQEYYYQQTIKSKIEGKNMPSCRSKGQILVILFSELRGSKEDLVNKKIGTDDKSKTGHGVGHRLSFALASVLHGSSSKVAALSSSANPSQASNEESSRGEQEKILSAHLPSLLRSVSFRGEKRNWSRGLSVKLPLEKGENHKLDQRYPRRTSYPYNIEERPEASANNQELYDPQILLKPSFLMKRPDSRRSNRSHEDSKEERINLGDNCDYDSADGGGSVSETLERTGSDQPRHRLQRQKAQSRKTFRHFGKSRRGGGANQDKELSNKQDSVPQVVDDKHLSLKINLAKTDSEGKAKTLNELTDDHSNKQENSKIVRQSSNIRPNSKIS